MKLSNFDELLKKQEENYSSNPNKYVSEPVVWCANSDTADSYEVNEEWIGVTRDGTLVWAYASGCSCWDGDYETEILSGEKTIKTMKLIHDHEPQEWLDAVERFKNTGEIQNI